MRGYKLEAFGDVVELYIYDRIGLDPWTEQGIDPRDVVAALKQHKQASELHVRLNTPGGSVMDATTIYNHLHEHPARVTTKIDGAAWSAGSFLAMVGDEIEMAKNASMMLHPARGGWFAETSIEHREAADLLDKITAGLADIYADRTGQPREVVDEWLSGPDRWFTAAEAMEAGLVTRVIDNAKVDQRAAAFHQQMAVAMGAPSPLLASIGCDSVSTSPMRKCPVLPDGFVMPLTGQRTEPLPETVPSEGADQIAFLRARLELDRDRC